MEDLVVDLERLIASNVEWRRVYKYDTVDEKVECFNNLLLGLYEKHAPLKEIKVKKEENPWMTRKILNMLNRRDRARKKFIRTKCPIAKELFCQLRNQCKTTCKSAKDKYFYSSFSGKHSSKEV